MHFATAHLQACAKGKSLSSSTSLRRDRRGGKSIGGTEQGLAFAKAGKLFRIASDYGDLVLVPPPPQGSHPWTVDSQLESDSRRKPK